MADEQGNGSRLRTDVPHIARVYDYLIGGKNNYPADRAVGDRMLQAMPEVAATMRANRAFLGRAVHYLAAEAGLRQFLDIGTGLPSANNTHEVAQAAAPDSRIVYVDNDPLVLVHANALLTSTPEGATHYLEADLRDPQGILDQARDLLDFSQPIALMLVAILHCVSDDAEAQAIIRELTAPLPSGSHIVITHPCNDMLDHATEAADAFNQHSTDESITLRNRDQVTAFFGEWDLVTPGVVPISHWRPGVGITPPTANAWGGVARKP